MQVNQQLLEITPRRGIIVWMYSLKQVRNLRRYGSVLYVSKKMKYVVVYLNETDLETSIPKIERLHFVRQVDYSYRPDIEMNFAEKIGKKQVYNQVDDGFDIEEKNTHIRLAENV